VLNKQTGRGTTKTVIDYDTARLGVEYFLACFSVDKQRSYIQFHGIKLPVQYYSQFSNLIWDARTKTFTNSFTGSLGAFTTSKSNSNNNNKTKQEWQGKQPVHAFSGIEMWEQATRPSYKLLEYQNPSYDSST
jgi:hypothetical protein